MVKTKRSIILLISVILSSFLFLSAQTPPENFLNFKVGEDRKLADYNQIMAYFKKLAEESPRLKVIEIGQTTLKKPMIMAVITSEANMPQLDRYREIARRLRDARNLNEDQARRLAREGKVILLITCSLHATEIAASQMSMELAYKLVTGQTPFEADRVLNEVIVLLVPTSNPDGIQMVVDWYKKYVGTKYEGGPMPWLYHHYAGHDNNRDWFMFNLPETRAIARVQYHDWIPQVHIDEHQMGSTGARLFIPPFMNPPLPNVHPLVWRGINLCGTAMAYDLQRNGFSGIVHGRSYTGWYIGACDDTSWLHNTIGLLSEAASVRVASPIYIEPTEIPKDYYEKSMDFVDPWKGGWWRLRDLIDYELTLSLSLIKTCYLYKEDFLFNFYLMNREAIEKKWAKDEPFAFVISAKQHDYPTALRMLEILRLGGVEIHQAQQDFVAQGKFYPAGSFVVLMSQPYKAYAWALLEKQEYPDIRQYPGGPPVPPYDNAAWTLPLQMGVSCDEIQDPFEAKLVKLETIPYPSISLPESKVSPYLALDSRQNASFAVAMALLKEKIEVTRSKEEIKGDNFTLAAGSFLFANRPETNKILKPLIEKWSLPVYGLKEIASIPQSRIKLPRIGLYQSWRANMDEGWTRYLLDDLAIPFKTLKNSDFKGTKEKKVNLRSDYDVIIFADESADIIKSGRPAPSPERPERAMAAYPPEYEGGIEKEGIDALKAFVEQGGILITLNRACELAIRELEAPVRNVLERVERTRFFCPTSLLELEVDNTTPLGYGFPKKIAAMFVNSLALETRIPPADWDRKVVANFGEKNILLSGWLLGEDLITRKAAVVDLTYKKGKIFLIAIRSQHRAQSHGTYKFILNSLLYPDTN
ncbi:MAG: M14 family metallopeptidase [Candidatus Aminicenantes bacterium]|nr:M14 family metallopeptidase [Candidatus Aminicenantes bacterium]